MGLKDPFIDSTTFHSKTKQYQRKSFRAMRLQKLSLNNSVWFGSLLKYSIKLESKRFYMNQIL